MKARIVVALLALLASPAAAQQPKISISNLPPAALPLTGAEFVPIVQSGVTRRTPVLSLFSSAQIAASQLPPFVGGDCSTTAGSVSIDCGTTFGRIMTLNSWELQQTFKVAPVFLGLTGYLRGNGTSPLTASPTVPLTDVAGSYAGGDFAGSSAQAPKLLTSAVRGAVFYKGATDNAPLAPGATGTVLTSNGPGADPSYAPPGALLIPPIHYAGQVIMMRMPNCPTGSLLEDGSSYSPSTYPQLYAAIGTTWGGTASVPLLPDSRGQFDRGWSSDQTVDSGRTFGSAQLDALQSHTHSVAGTIASFFNGVQGGGGFTAANSQQTINSGPAGGGARTATETRPTNITAYHCIFTANSP